LSLIRLELARDFGIGMQRPRSIEQLPRVELLER
jgi:hypothetical protein